MVDFEFVPVAVETSGIIGSTGCSLLLISAAAFRGPPMIPARCLTSFNRFQLPSSEATPWLLQPHQGNISRSWLRDTDIQSIVMYILPIIMLIIVKIINPFKLTMITVNSYQYNLSINETSYFQQALYNKQKTKMK